MPSAEGAEENPNQSCLECHQDQELTLTREGREVSLFVDAAAYAASKHGESACTDCHAGLDPDALPHADPVPRVNCLECHADTGPAHAFHPAIGTLEAMGSTPEVDCARCHGTHDVVARDDERAPFAPSRSSTACGACHAVEVEHFLASAHAGADAQVFPDCLSCHRTRVVPNGIPLLDVKLAQSQLCLSCHVDSPAAAARTRLAGRFVASWGHSVHGQALERGEAGAASCVDCHGSHEMKRAMVADSRVNKLHITETCRRCHEAEAVAYTGGAHDVALQHGALDAPVCTDCHGEHQILASRDPASPVAPRNVSQQLCGDCHGSVRLSQKYGLASDRFETFADSFHGLAVRGGAVEVVNCASCHGAHAILPSTDPASPIHKANLVRTCGQCHPGANERFAVGSVHVSLAPTSNGNGGGGEPVLQIVATIYVWVIVVVVGGMVLHNAFDFLKKVRLKVHGHVFGIAHEEAVPHRLYLRLSVNERLQHGLLAASFVVLVVTGFMLRYPEAWWVEGLRSVSSHLFEWRGWLHRAAAVAMVGAGVWHAWYVVGTARGRQLIRDLWPRRNDFTDAWQVLRYNLGMAKTKPAFPRFSYIEKTEYWAMLWGSILMTVTGVLLWADETTMGLLTKLGFDLSRVVHFYEAVLATLAIIVWHFYFVIFNPEVYPMNLSWLTGYLSEEEMAAEHPAELEKLKQAEQAQRTAEPPAG
jgi:cytochrome b subunit of formate dehydrogenase